MRNIGAPTATTGQMLADKLEELGMGKRRLSRESGVSYRTVCRIIKGDRVGSLDTWMRIADALGCSVSDLTGELGSARKPASSATVFEHAQKGDERSIDAAFEAVDIASRFYSTGIASAVAERWLWGAGWKQVAHMLGCTRPRAFRKCLDCFEWMDKHVEFVEVDGEMSARYVKA